MIKRVFYNDNLIPIGNAPVYDGKIVYSDGRVAYGWNYVPQKAAKNAVADKSGFWINDVIGTKYKLAGKNLKAGRWLRGKNINFEQYCLPCAINAVQVKEIRNYDLSVNYNFAGEIVYVDNTGRMVTYDGSIKEYAADGTYTSMPLNLYPCFDRFKGNYTALGGVYYSTVDEVDVYNNSLYDNCRRLLQLATFGTYRLFRPVAECKIDNVFIANTETYMDITLRGITSATLYSADVLFESGSSFVDTITSAGGRIRVRAGSAGTGTIRITYTYNGMTVTGDIPIVITASPYLSERSLFTLAESKIVNGTLQDEVYPQFYELATDIKIRLSDMALIVGNTVYNNDPLEILTFTTACPAAAHCYRVADEQDVTVGAYIASQDTGKLWYFDVNGNMANEHYAGLKKCWNLAYVDKKIIFA